MMEVKKMKKKILCTLLVASMMASALASCGSSGSSSSSSSSSKSSEEGSAAASETASESGEASESAGYTPNFDEDPYTVHFQYCVAAESSGQSDVSAALNELTLKELNMNVDLMPQTMGTWVTTMSMILAANEPLDLFLAGSGSFGTYMDSGYIRNWADYLDYLPDVLETLGDDVQAGYVGDFLVGFSQMKERGYQAGLVARKDIMDELGLTADDFSVTTQDLSSYNQITELFAKVKEAHPEMVGVGGTLSLAGSMGGDFADNLGNNFGMLENFGQTTTVTNWYETDICRAFVDLQREWFVNGYESADVATNQDGGETLMKAGNLFSFLCNIKPNTAVEKKAQTGYDVVVIPMSDTTFTSSMSVNAIVYSLANASEDPVKASAFYNWAYTSPEFNDLINWGVEGKDWVETSDGLAAYPDGVDATSVSYHQDYAWAYLNQFCAHAWEGNPTDIWQQYEEFNAGLLRSKAFGFNFDPTVVTDQVAQCTSVFDQYDNDVFFGAVDPEQGLADMNAALYAAGMQDIIDAKQSQLDAWLAEQD